MFSKSIYIKRREQLRKDVSSGIIIFPANDEAAANYAGNTFPYRQDSNFLYFFGHREPSMVGVIDIEANKDILYADDLSMDDIIWMGNLPSVAEMAMEVGVENTASLSDLAQMLKKAVESGRKIHYVAPYRAKMSIKMAAWLGKSLEEIAQGQSVELIKAIAKQRSIKSVEEVEEIEKAMIVAHQMHTTAMRMCKPGMYEFQISGAMEGIAASHHGGMSFIPIVSTNGQTLHNHNHHQILKEGRLMVADAGAEVFSNYCSDITRTTPVGGKYSQKQKEVYNIVLDANLTTIKNLKPGVPYRDYHLEACKIIADGLKQLGLMKGDIDEAVMSGAHALFMPHGLGHMMGLDVHDMENMGENLFGYDEEIKRSSQFGLAYLRLGRKLEEGFVITVEPGIYFIPALIDMWKAEKKFEQFINYEALEAYKDFGGIRIEDDVLITDTSCAVLGPKIPKKVEEVEDLCRA